MGTAFAEIDLDRANYETTIADLMSGQHSDSAARGDVQHQHRPRRGCVATIAQEILRRLGLEGRSVPSVRLSNCAAASTDRYRPLRWPLSGFLTLYVKPATPEIFVAVNGPAARRGD